MQNKGYCRCECGCRSVLTRWTEAMLNLCWDCSSKEHNFGGRAPFLITDEKTERPKDNGGIS